MMFFFMKIIEASHEHFGVPDFEIHSYLSATQLWLFIDVYVFFVVLLCFIGIDVDP